jgi:hypothetical protein
MKTAVKHTTFTNIFSTNTHGCSAECHCGVFHYDTCNQWDEDYHKKELPSAETSAVTNPKLFQFQDNAIEYLEFDGRQYVIGCRCGMTEFMFGFINEDKDKVLKYLIATKDTISVEDAM